MAMRLLELNNNSFALPSLTVSLYSVVYATRHCSVQQITRLFQRCHLGDLVTKFSEFS